MGKNLKTGNMEPEMQKDRLPWQPVFAVSEGKNQ